MAACGFEDEGYFAALVRMFERALTAVVTLPPPDQADLVDRLDRVRSALSNAGWGVKDAVDEVWFDLGPRSATTR